MDLTKMYVWINGSEKLMILLLSFERDIDIWKALGTQFFGRVSKQPSLGVDNRFKKTLTASTLKRRACGHFNP